MIDTRIRIGGIAALGLLAAGCGNIFPYTSTLDTEKRFLGDDSLVMTKAEHRAVVNVNVPAEQQGYGRVVPTRIICAEPSPDVAKAVSEGVSGAAAAAAEGQGEGSIAASRSYAEAIAQLGERLATIQLLRDGLYRACEAYANGAISDTTYAVIVSGIDDTMVTLHAAEIAGGAFGRSLAALGGEASGEPSASADVSTKQSDGDEAESTSAESEPEEASRERDSTVEAEAKSEAKTTFQAAGSITRTQDAQVAAKVVEIQKNFLDFKKDDNSGLIIACISALDRPVDDETPFTEICKIFFNNMASK